MDLKELKKLADALDDNGKRELMFNDLTNTPLQRTRRPHLWVRFIECMIEGFSLRKCAELLNDEVTHVTLFYWRHKILSALKQIPINTLQGIVEMDEAVICLSQTYFVLIRGGHLVPTLIRKD